MIITIQRDELHQAWAKVIYEIKADSKQEAIEKLKRHGAAAHDELKCAEFRFDEFEVGDSISVEDEDNWIVDIENE